MEALAASGLRSIRYAKEIDNVKKILSNDMSEEAVDSIKRNVKYNKVEDIVIPNKGDAMYDITFFFLTIIQYTMINNIIIIYIMLYYII